MVSCMVVSRKTSQERTMLGAWLDITCTLFSKGNDITIATIVLGTIVNITVTTNMVC